MSWSATVQVGKKDIDVQQSTCQIYIYIFKKTYEFSAEDHSKENSLFSQKKKTQQSQKKHTQQYSYNTTNHTLSLFYIFIIFSAANLCTGSLSL